MGASTPPLFAGSSAALVKLVVIANQHGRARFDLRISRVLLRKHARVIS